MNASSATTPGEGAEGPPRSFRRRRLRGPLGLALALLAISLLALFIIPLSIPWLNRELQRRWLEATETRLVFDDATLWLLRGRYRLEQPRVEDPRDGATLVSLARAEIDVPLLSFIFSKPPHTFDEIELTGPIELSAAVGDGGFRLLQPPERLVEIVRAKLARREKSSGGMRVGAIELESVRLRLVDGGTGATRVALADGALRIEFEEKKLNRIHLAGDVGGDDEGRPFELTVLPHGDAAASWTLEIRDFDTRRDLPAGALPADFATAGLTAEGHVARGTQGSWSTAGRVLMAETRVARIGARPLTEAPSFDRIAGLWDLAWDRAAGRVNVERLALRGGASQVALAGSIATGAPHPYVLREATVSLEGEMLALAAAWLPPGRLLNPEAAAVRLTLAAAGDGVTTMPRRAEGGLRFAGITLDAPSLPAPIEMLSGALRLTTDTVRVASLTGLFEGIPVQMEGSVSGSPLAGRIRAADIAWETTGSLEALERAAMEMPRGSRGRPPVGMRVTGDVRGAGRLAIEEGEEAPWPAALRRARAEGDLVITSATIAHPRLPEPVVDFGAQVEFASEEVRLRSATARMGRTALSTTATLRGTAGFWTSPTLTGSARLRGELREVRRQAQALTSSTALAELPPARGSADVTLSVNRVRLSGDRAVPIQARLDLRDFATSITAERLKQPLAFGGSARGTFGATITRPTTATAPRVNPATVTADFRLAGGWARGPDLPQPISGISGGIGWKENRLTLDQLEGKLLGAQVNVTGTVAGLRGGKAGPTGDLNLEVRSDLDNAREVAGRYDINLVPPGFEPLRGDATLSLDYDGPFKNWQAADYSGRLALSDFSTAFEIAGVNGPVRAERRELVSEAPTGRRERSDCRFGDLAMHAEGEARPGGLTANLTASGPLEEMKARVPVGLKYFRQVGGNATLEHTQTYAPAEGFTPPANWAGAVDYFKQVTAEEDPAARFAEDWVDHYEGTIDLRAAELTHQVLPTQLAGLTGAARYEKGRLWTPQPIDVQAGVDSRGLRSKLEILWDQPDSGEVISFDATGDHFALDEWISGWGPGRDPQKPRKSWPADAHYNPDMKPRFSVRGTVKTATGVYYRVEGANINAALNFDLYENQPNMLRWYLSQATIHEGMADVNGSLFNKLLDVQIETRRVRLRPLVEAIMQRERPGGVYSGLVTGNMKLSRRFESGGEEQPLRGEGQIRLEESRFVSNAIFNSLGGILRLPIFEDISFSSVHGPVTIHDNAVWSPEGITFDNPLVHLKVAGHTTFEREMRLQVTMQFLGMTGRVPLLGNAVDIFNRLVGNVLTFQVRGTYDSPRVIPIVDEDPLFGLGNVLD